MNGDCAQDGSVIMDADKTCTATFVLNTAGIDGADIGGSISITEGGATGTYDFKLSTQPTGDVEIIVTADTQTEVSKDGGTNFNNTVILTFTNDDWNTAQTITVQSIDDSSAEGSHSSTITHAITGTVNDANYPLTLALDNVTVNITDNDSSGVTVNPTTLTVSEPNSNATFTITLNTLPTADVAIASVAASNGQCSVSPTSTTITKTNWNTGTIFTVMAQDDNNVDGNQTCTVQISPSTSTDGNYNNLKLTDVTVTVQDDDTAGIDGAEIGGSISLIEGGATGTYDIWLSSQPTGDVEITVTADAQTKISSDSTTFSNTVTLTFTNDNWNTAQTVTVQSIDDSDIEDSHSGTITHAITGTINDANYPDTLSLGNVTVNITENEVVSQIDLSEEIALECQGCAIKSAALIAIESLP